MLYFYYCYELFYDTDMDYSCGLVTIYELQYGFSISLWMKLATNEITCFWTQYDYYEYQFKSSI